MTESALTRLAEIADRALASLAQPDQLLALASVVLAGLLVIVSAFVKTMIPLRWLAVGSNAGFIVYGLAYPSPLMVVLHAVLLPVNLWRVRQMVTLTRRVMAVAVTPAQMQTWLRPYMRSRRLRAGTTIFSLGDAADRMYFLVSGRIDLPEIHVTLEAGEMFGEIAFFTPERLRRSSARCATACTVMSIDEDTFRQLVYQNPDFGLEIVRLIATRLSADLQRLKGRQPAAG